MRTSALSLGGLVLLASLPFLAAFTRVGGETMGVTVGPPLDSVLEYDSPQTLAVRELVKSVLVTRPSCLAGKIEDALEAQYPGLVTTEQSESAWNWVWVDPPGKFVHQWNNLDSLRVDFGQGRVGEVLVSETITD
jgi:hypothetical protein